MKCPHCNCRAFVRSSEQIALNTFRKYYSCSNSECGYRFVGVFEILHGVQESLIPNDNVDIAPPIRSAYKRKGNCVNNCLSKQLKDGNRNWNLPDPNGNGELPKSTPKMNNDFSNSPSGKQAKGWRKK